MKKSASSVSLSRALAPQQPQLELTHLFVTFDAILPVPLREVGSLLPCKSNRLYTAICNCISFLYLNLVPRAHVVGRHASEIRLKSVNEVYTINDMDKINKTKASRHRTVSTPTAHAGLRNSPITDHVVTSCTQPASRLVGLLSPLGSRVSQRTSQATLPPSSPASI